MTESKSVIPGNDKGGIELLIKIVEFIVGLFDGRP